jgi:hypothetical protein
MQTWPWLAFVLLLIQPSSLLAQEGKIPDPAWRVARGQFTSGISNREPIDRLVVATPLIREVYFFTDLRQLQGRTVTHRWEYQGKVISQVPFEVGGPRWRVYSRKEIEPEQVGRWSVTVIDQSGWPLYTELFRYEDGAPLLQHSEGLENGPSTDEVTSQKPERTSVRRSAEPNSFFPDAGSGAAAGRVPQLDSGQAGAAATRPAAGATNASEE